MSALVSFGHEYGAALKPSERSAAIEWLGYANWSSAKLVRECLIDNVACPANQRVPRVDDAAFDGLVLLLAEHLTRERSAAS